MSLRKFHIFFISISSLLCFGLIFWGVWNFKTTGNLQSLGLTAFGAVGTVLLAAYLKWFLKKYSKLMSMGFAAMVGTMSVGYSPQLLACSVCFTDPDSPMTRSALLGVLFLGGVIVSVLVSIVFVARSWVKRAQSLNIPL